MTGPDYRPGYHVTPDRNWMNDPNGLVYHRGVYHLFFQHNPHGDGWANMSWGHASSTDLLRWHEHPVAIPRTADEQIFSGSVVVDHDNSAGFGVDGDPALVAIYTGAYTDGRQAQSLAASVDDGTTWTKYPGNPVLDRGSTAFRDPKVFWYQSAEGPGYWVMVAVEAQACQILLYRSKDLRTWTYLSVFTGGGGEPADAGVQQFWECPDLFPLPVADVPGTVTWVLLFSVNPDGRGGGSATRHVLGNFDGISFTPAPGTSPRRLDWGADFYAATSFTDAPGGRRIIMGWMGNWEYAAQVPTSPWRGLMTLPREVSIVAADGQQELVQRPIPELLAIEEVAHLSVSGPFTLDGTLKLPGGRHYKVDLTFQAMTARRFGVDVLVGGDQRTRIRYDTAAKDLSIDRSQSGDTAFHHAFPSIEHAPVPLAGGLLHLEVFVDRISVEVFAQRGRTCLTELAFPATTSTHLELVSLDGITEVLSVRHIPLRLPALLDPVASGRSAEAPDTCPT